MKHKYLSQMKTKILLFCLALVMMAGGALAQNRADSTYIDASVETYTPNFDKVSILFEQFLEQNSLRIEKKTKDYYEIKYSLVMWKNQFADLKNKLDEWKCQTIKLSETTRYIPPKKNSKKDQINELLAKIREFNESLAKAETESRIEHLQDLISDAKSDIREYENDIRELDSKNGTVVLDITLMREPTTPNASMKVRFVNMPGFEYSIFMPENPTEGISAEYYHGYMLKYLFTRGKSYITVGAFKANEVPQNDTLMYSDIFNISFGQDFYSRHFGRGSRKFFNMYSGYNVGFMMYSGEKTSQKTVYLSPSVGVELFKNRYVLWDLRGAYYVPIMHNYDLRGWQFSMAFNVAL